MRIAVAAHSDSRVGGVETYLAGVVPALARRYAVACLFERTSGDADPVLRGARDVPVWVAGEEPHAALQSLRRWSPDVIYLHAFRSPALERQLTRIAPVVFFAHSYYGACISGEKSTRFPVQAPCGRALAPSCLLHYLPRGCGGSSPVTMVRQYAGQRTRRDLLARYERVLVASRYMADQYAREGVPSVRVTLPVAAVPPTPRRADHEPSNLLFLGRLERSKGAHLIVRAAAQAAARRGRRVRLAVAGRGTLAGDIAAEAAAYPAAGVPLQVDLCGWLAEGARAAALQQADLLLMPSLWPEPFGLSGLEAGSAGVPAVAFAVGGIPEWLADGVNGRLVAPGGDAVGGLAAAVADLLNDPAALAAMRVRAIEAASRFTLERHLGELQRVFADAAAVGPRAGSTA